MVLAERNTDLVRNGRRSRGPSPNNGHGSVSTGSGVGGGGGSGGGGGTGVGGNANNNNATSITVGGAGTPETSSDDDNSIKRNGKSKTKQSEYEEKIRVGRDYQAICPPLIPEPERKPEILNDRALLVWSPTKDIPDSKLEEYISVAKEKYGYNGEQALGMLFWHKHDLERAVVDLSNFTPFPDEWTVEDKVLFEQAFQFHGKSFHRIRQMLPDKSIASLVKYYYSWKKTRHRQSVMDRQEKAKASKEGSENGSENGSNEESDNDDKDQSQMASTSGTQEHSKQTIIGGGGTGCDTGASTSTKSQASKINFQNDNNNLVANEFDVVNEQHKQQRSLSSPSSDVAGCSGIGGGSDRVTPLAPNSNNGGGFCSNCGVACNLLNVSPQGKLCLSCHHHWRRTGNMRPTSGPYLSKRSRDSSADRRKRKPPKGMYINHDDIVALASGNEDILLSNAEREIATLLTKIQLNKQIISQAKRKNAENIQDIRPPESANRISSRWTNDELLLAVQGVRKYGKDFQMIADILGTKTEANVRTFYVNYRRRYNLDEVLKQYEADKEAQAPSVSTASTSSSSTLIEETASTSSTATLPTAAAANNTTTAATAGKREEIKKKENTNEKTLIRTDTILNSNTKMGTGTINEKPATNAPAKLPVPMNTDHDVELVNSSDIVMEIDLDEPMDVVQPPSKKLAITDSAQDMPKASIV